MRTRHSDITIGTTTSRWICAALGLAFLFTPQWMLLALGLGFWFAGPFADRCAMNPRLWGDA